MTRLLFVLPFCLLTLLLGSACGQTYAFDSTREATVALDGTWRFHTGDDPSYASPGFNDSNWPLLSSSNAWYRQKEYENYRGFAWYRFRVQLPSQPNRPIALRVGMYGNYEIFADGLKLASCGTMPPAKSSTLICRSSTVLLASGASGKIMTIAIRDWTEYAWLGGPDRVARIGDPSLIRLLDQASMDGRWAKDTQEDVMIVLEGLAGIAACILFLFRRTEAEYLWFGLIMANIAMGRGLSVYRSSHSMSLVGQVCGLKYVSWVAALR